MSCSIGGINKVLPSRDSARIVKMVQLENTLLRKQAAETVFAPSDDILTLQRYELFHFLPSFFCFFVCFSHFRLQIQKLFVDLQQNN